MLWNKARRSHNVNDTREGKDARALKGKTLAAGLATVALTGAALYSIVGTTPDATFPAPSPPATLSTVPADDPQLMFVQSILGDTEDTWNQIFAQTGRQYRQPLLTLFEVSVVSACGYAGATNGPFYCPGNQQVYLDLEFFKKIDQQYSVVDDFARAFIIAHEVGHHVQLELEMSAPFENALRDQQAVSGDGGLEVRAELQADCLAGVWAHHAQRRLDWMEPGDIEAALQAATVFGDDHLQRSRNSPVRPETFSHGTSEQRVNWFKTGFASGLPQACDTFTATDL
jgi:predicted metalloprotease